MISSPDYHHVLTVGLPDAGNNFVYPQVESMGPGYDLDSPDSVAAIDGNHPLGFVPNLSAFHLSDATRVTDLLSQTIIAAAGLLASKRLCDVLRDLVIQQHQSFTAEVVSRGESYAYRWLHFTGKVENQIDFARSRLTLRRYDGTAAPLTIASHEEFRAEVLRLANTMGGDLAVDLCVFLPGTPRFDLLVLCMPAPSFYVSGELADRLMGLGLSGFEIAATPTKMVFES
jgi:hypothetical protein